MSDDELDDGAPGWDAIDAALRPLVGTEAAQHWGTGTALPDQDGIWGVSAYRRDDHLLYVTYGLTELFGKVTDDPVVSGWGAELTMRIPIPAGGAGDGEVPTWPAALLARLGELVYQRRTRFEPGGRMEMSDGGGEVPPGLAWTDDPELAPVDGPFGRFSFVATMGTSTDLLAEMRATTTATVVDRIRPANPLLVTGGPGLTW